VGCEQIGPRFTNAFAKLDAQGAELDLSQLTMHHCVVPDRNIPQLTLDAALAMLNDLVTRGRAASQIRKSPWWKFW
jgi:hypothetical protein